MLNLVCYLLLCYICFSLHHRIVLLEHQVDELMNIKETK